MAAADRLSALPDRVLQRVVSLLPVGDAARTSVLSQRWRTLWLQADSVILDSRCYQDVGYNGGRVGRQLFRAALAAVRAAGRQPVRRLSVVADSYFQNDFLKDIMRTSPGMDAVLAAPATGHLEELRMKMQAEFLQSYDEYVLPASSLPCRSTLRVLDLYGCTLGPPGAAAAFPLLETLKMVSCITSLEGLQAMLDTAQSLRRLWLKAVSFMDEELDREARLKRRLLLRCPEATAAVTVIRIHCHGTDGLVVDAPGARFLRYKGFPEHFPLGGPAAPSGPPENLQDAQLSFCTERWCYNDPPPQEAPQHAVFWESIGRFSRLRVLKLKLLDINDVAVVNAKEEGVFLKAFPELVFLDVEGSYEEDTHGAAVAIANLLLCCPALQEFHLNCKLHGDLYALPKRMSNLSDEKKARLNLEKSMESLKRFKSETEKIASPSFGLDDDDTDDLAALKARSFPCLESHLRKIRLEFELKCFNCFEVRLAKFLVENALVLEEMEVHDGNQRVSGHIHRNIPIWRANSSKSKIKIVGEHYNAGSSL